MRAVYIWQQPTWAEFQWNNERLITLLSDVRNLEGRIMGLMEGVGFNVQNATSLDVMVEDVLRTSERSVINLSLSHWNSAHVGCCHIYTALISTIF